MATVSIDIRDDIRKANDKAERAFEQGDAAVLADLYTEDGMILPTGSDFIKGKQAIASFWQAGMDMGLKWTKLETVEVESHDDTAIEMGTYTLGGEEGLVMDQGKYIVIWKYEDEQWKLHRGIFNSNLSPSR